MDGAGPLWANDIDMVCHIKLHINLVLGSNLMFVEAYPDLSQSEPWHLLSSMDRLCSPLV
jgi:hypothetical protein